MIDWSDHATDEIIVTGNGLLADFSLLKVAVQAVRERPSPEERERRRDERRAEKFGNAATRRAMWAAYRRARADGLGMVDAFSASVDELRRRVGFVGPPAPDAEPAAPTPKLKLEQEPEPVRAKSPDVIGIAQDVVVNSVAVIGVYGMDWSVGTALALYWCENILTAVVVIALLGLWLRGHAGAALRPRIRPGEVAEIALVFNAAHAGFLLAFLGVILPRSAPDEAFQRQFFIQGALIVASLLAIGFVLTALRLRTLTAEQVQKSAMQYVQRIVVLPLTIIFGMFAVALFGGVRVFFGVFAALKFIAAMSWRVPAPRVHG